MGGYDNEKLYETLLELEIIDKKVLAECLKESKEKEVPLDSVLTERDLIKDDSLGKIIGDMISLPYVNLSTISIPDSVLRIIPEKAARKQQMIAYELKDNRVSVATPEPQNPQFIDFLKKKTGMIVFVCYTTSRGFEKALSLYSKNITQAFDEIIAESVADAKKATNAEPPIIKIVDTMIDYANQNEASDIHIEPLEEGTLVRFRIDGVLHDMISLPKELNPQIVTRIKIMANLRTDEHQESQDGKITYKTEEEDLDIRVSIAPITKGEKVVMRLLSEKSRQFSLADLGFSGEDLKKVEEAYRSPHGMILSTGPTGSGKTTTLYAILKLINQRDINIMTIEDPVEYQVENVNQMQVNERAGVTFADGLRSIVRQDPDVILVGEIRDNETAGIAINSAMTGHLVLSTLHTNDAATSFPRLIDMDIEPYLVASTVNVVIAQRLVRKICQKCRVSEEVPLASLDEQIRKHLPKKTTLQVYKGKGCPVCHMTGYTGRVGIFEVMEIDENIREAAVAKKSSQEIQAVAIKGGMKTMLEDGIEKVKQGITSIEELLRVTKE